MLQLIQSKIVAGIALTLLGGYAAVGAFAAPEITPWPDLGSGADHTEVPDLPAEADVSNDASMPELPDAAEVPGQADADAQGGAVAQGQPTDTLGVPADSPACEQVGCRTVDTPDGLSLNLPEPAADGIEQAADHAADAQQHGLPDQAHPDLSDGVPLGPPEGVPTSSGQLEDGLDEASSHTDLPSAVKSIPEFSLPSLPW